MSSAGRRPPPPETLGQALRTLLPRSRARALPEAPLSRLVQRPDHHWLRASWPALALLVLVIGVAADQAVVALAGGTVFVTGWLARAWARLALERVRFTHTLAADHVFAGEALEYRVQIENRKALPLAWLEVRTDFPEALPPDGHTLLPSGALRMAWLQRVTSVRWYERVEWRYQVPALRRGFYRIGPTRLRAGDLFGFFTQERADAPALAFWVYPRLAPLPPVPLPWRRPYGDARGGPAYAEDPSRLRGLRDAAPGDPLNRIDWKASARRGRLQSRISEPSASGRVLLALNVTTAAEIWIRSGGGRFERAVTATASLAAGWLEAGLAVGMIANCTVPGVDATIHVPSSRHPAQRARLMEALAMADAFTVAPMERLLAEEARSLPAGSTVVLVTPLLTEALGVALHRLQRHGHRAVVVYVAEDGAPPFLAGVPVYDVSAALAAAEAATPQAAGPSSAGWARPRAGDRAMSPAPESAP